MQDIKQVDLISQGFQFKPYNHDQQRFNSTSNSQLVPIQFCKLAFFRKHPQQIEDEHKNDTKEIQKYKKIKKQKIAFLPHRHTRKIAIVNTFNRFDSDNPISIDYGLYISRDGFVRFSYILSLVSFGLSFHEISSVSYQKKSNLIQVLRRSTPQPGNVTMEQGMKFLASTKCKMYPEICSALLHYSKFKDELEKSINSIPISDYLIGLKEAEMSQFLVKSYNYMENYSDTHQSEIFSYQFGRVDYSKRKVELNHTGYSKSFLDLIGIDVENFSSILLRHQKIDLVPDREEIMKQSIYCMTQPLLQEDGFPLDFNIKTFDGFPLRIHTKNKLHFLPNFHFRRLLEFPIEYIIRITTIEVDLQDLQSLISYREKLLQKSNLLSFDDFIKKELSFFFEDVEYSVHSQTFIEKYYEENLAQLYEMRCDKLQQMNRQNTQNGDTQELEKQSETFIMKECGFSTLQKI